jgi:signal transduction histidine kinase
MDVPSPPTKPDAAPPTAIPKLPRPLQLARLDAERRLVELSEAVAKRQDEERRRIAREIHDYVGQQMTALRLSLGLLAELAAVAPSLSAHIARTRQIAEELDRSIDAVTQQLTPVSLQEVEFHTALELLVADWSDRFGIPSRRQIDHTGELALPPGGEGNLYRLVQETLHNVVKHAQATSVSVSLTAGEHDVLLLVEDDGRGFEVGHATDPATGREGVGLTSMRERAALAGAHFGIESTPGRGTRIVVRIPRKVSLERSMTTS